MRPLSTSRLPAQIHHPRPPGGCIVEVAAGPGAGLVQHYMAVLGELAQATDDLGRGRRIPHGQLVKPPAPRTRGTPPAEALGLSQ